MPNLPQPADIRQKVEGSIYDFQISAQSLMKESCHNFRTSDDINMKLEPETKLNKKNKTTSERFDDGPLSANCDVIIIFPIFG